MPAPPASVPPADRMPLRRLAVIGAGPRGIAVIERLGAASRTEAWRGAVEVHLIDPHVDRGGAVWRTDQSRALLMNTATCQTTMYPDASCAPVLPVEGAQTLAEFLGREDNGGYGPADIAPRAEHGRYLLTVLAQAEAAADPSRLRIVRRAAEARDVTGPLDGPQRVHLDDGEVLEVDAVVLALGHLATAPSPRSRRIAEAAERLGLLHVPSANPLEVDYTALLGRERVAVQGMGLNFYDAVGMLCEAAGGRFLEDPSTPSGLRYLPGGAEPQLLVGSRTGVVYRPKPDLRPHLPAPYEPTVLTGGMVESLAARPGGLDHERDVLPLMVAELTGAMARAGFDALADEEAILRLLFPLGRRARALPDAHARTRAVLREAIAAASAPDPAWTLAFRVLSALRIRVNELVDRGAYTSGSFLRDIDGFLKNAFASWASGPPVRRAREALALEEAGLLVFAGPAMSIEVDESARRFAVRAGDGPAVLCDGVLEAHLPGVDLPRFTSPLVRAWRERGEVRAALLPDRHGDEPVATGSIDAADDGTLIGTDGEAFARRILLGIPVSTAQPGSAITAEPGTAPQLLRRAERAAIDLARHAGALPRTSGEELVPWAMQIVVLRDKKALAADVDVAEAGARAVVALLDDERSALGGPWHDALARWVEGGRIRKIVRRADGKRWRDVQELEGVTVEVPFGAAVAGPAAVRALPPGPVRPLPHALDKLQVGGTTFVHEGESRTEDAPVTVEVSPLIEITSGKLVAQVAHAAQRAYDLMDAETRAAWRAQGFAVRVERADETTWARGGRPVSIVDAGYTELGGPTETTRARW